MITKNLLHSSGKDQAGRDLNGEIYNEKLIFLSKKNEMISSERPIKPWVGPLFGDEPH